MKVNIKKITNLFKGVNLFPKIMSGIIILVLVGVISFLDISRQKLKNEAASLQNQLDQFIQGQTTCPISGSGETNSNGIYQSYQGITNQLAELRNKDFTDQEIKLKITELTQEIQKLSVLNPYIRFKEIKQSFIPTGVPEVYGQELNISFDAVQDAINKVAVFGPTYGKEGEKIILTGDDLERYKDIGASISCEYCCGVKTLTQKDGTAACGCAHSIMMRGLTAYLIKNHPELSNQDILGQLTMWKKTYFPKQTLMAKLQEMKEAGEPGIKEVLEEFPDFLPQMVGGC